MAQTKSKTIYIHIYQSQINSYTRLPDFSAIGLSESYTLEDWSESFPDLGTLKGIIPYEVIYNIEDSITAEINKLKQDIKRIDADTTRGKTNIQTQINDLLMLGTSDH